MRKVAVILGFIFGLFLGIVQIGCFITGLSEYGWGEPLAMILWLLSAAFPSIGIVGAILTRKGKELIGGLLMLACPILGFLALLVADGILGLNEAWLGVAAAYFLLGPPLIVAGILSVILVFRDG